MGIHVMEDWTTRHYPAVNDPECTRCGTCVDQCRGDVLTLGFRPIKGDQAEGARPSSEPCEVPEGGGVLPG